MQNKKPFYFFFSLNNAYYCAPVYVSRMENTRHDTLRMKLSAIFALMLLLVPYLVKLLEAGMGWDLSFLGVYPRQARGIAGIFTHPPDTCRRGPLAGQYAAVVFPFLVPLLFLSSDSRLHPGLHLGGLRADNLSYWPSRVARGGQRSGLWAGLLPFLQRGVAQVRAADGHLAAGYLSLW